MNAPAGLPRAIPHAVAIRPVASLGMYDAPELHAANDALWHGIAVRLRSLDIPAPSGLTRTADLSRTLRDPRLLLGHTCGLPLVTTLSGHVQLVATPRYRAPGCRGVFHSSAIIVPKTSAAASLLSLRGGRCAVNSPDSNTGANLLQAEIAPFAGPGPYFSAVQITGSHLASLAAVAAGAADVAAIDAVTLALARRSHPELVAGVRILAWTQLSPGLPLVTSITTPPRTLRALRRVLQEVAADPALKDARETLLLEDFTVIPRRAYDEIDRIRAAASARGYSTLA